MADESNGEVAVYVPPGQSRVVRVPRPSPPAVADRLILTGELSDFDNTLYVTPIRQAEITIVYIGHDRADDQQGLQYFLRLALADTCRRGVAPAHVERRHRADRP